jgi:hypothetical protein
MLNSAAGIRDQSNYITATDSTHYTFVSGLKIKNQDTANPLNITGANIVPDSGPSTDIYDLSNGASIALNFSRVEWATAAIAADVAAAVWADSKALTTPKFLGLK